MEFLRHNRVVIVIHSLVTLIPTYLYDIGRFVKYATLGGWPSTYAQYQSVLTKEYHSIEKALSFRDFRPYSSQRSIKALFAVIDRGVPTYGLGSAGNTALHVIAEYIKYHHSLGFNNDYIQDLSNRLENYLLASDKNWIDGGTFEITRKEMLEKSACDLEPFLHSRFSVREFSDKSVDISLVKQAVFLAKKTPSVCNRQGWKLHLVTTKPQVEQILGLQGGSRGFSDTVDKLIIVTSVIGAFHETRERNQNWIDGGMFSMSFLYALHSLGVGSCCLNWTVKPALDKKLRKLVPMQKDESVIMLIAVGHYPDVFKVCQSARKDTEELLEIH